MRRLKIITDSTSDLSADLIKELDVTVVPLGVNLGEESYLDGVDVTPEKIFEWSDRTKQAPKTNAVNPVHAIKALKPLVGDDELDVIVICISEQLSTTANVFRLAAEEVGLTNYRLIDSHGITSCLTLLIMEAKRLYDGGSSLDEVAARLELMRRDVRCSFIVDTLDYLARGGRCSSTVSLLASALKVKPMIEVRDARLVLAKKYRGRYEAVVDKYLRELRSELLSANTGCIFIVSVGVDKELLDFVYQYIKSIKHFKKIYMQTAGSTISCHCGPNTLGLVYLS